MAPSSDVRATPRIKRLQKDDPPGGGRAIRGYDTAWIEARMPDADPRWKRFLAKACLASDAGLDTVRVKASVKQKAEASVLIPIRTGDRSVEHQ
jgi:hypothetical protein